MLLQVHILNLFISSSLIQKVYIEHFLPFLDKSLNAAQGQRNFYDTVVPVLSQIFNLKKQIQIQTDSSEVRLESDLSKRSSEVRLRPVLPLLGASWWTHQTVPWQQLTVQEAQMVTLLLGPGCTLGLSNSHCPQNILYRLSRLWALGCKGQLELYGPSCTHPMQTLALMLK